MKYNPRRPFDPEKPEGYQESDKDYIENNIELVLEYLDSLAARERRRESLTRNTPPEIFKPLS